MKVFSARCFSFAQLKQYAHLWLIIFFAHCCAVIGGCARGAAENPVNTEETPALVTWSGAYPAAILQPGIYPLWFQLTEDGPVHIGTIEEAVSESALIPWPYAPHISSMENYDDGIVMAVNRDGFLKISSGFLNESGLALYRFSGGEFWNQYTVGGFVFYDGDPVALIYPEDRFLDTASPMRQRTSRLFPAWSFNMNSNTPFPYDVPALQFFPEYDGTWSLYPRENPQEDIWIIDTLRRGEDGFFYIRGSMKRGYDQRSRMYRLNNLSRGFSADQISAETFFNSFPRETNYNHPSLPHLPEGFVYTGINYIADSIAASWEEQIDYSIGAAGFVIIKVCL